MISLAVMGIGFFFKLKLVEGSGFMMLAGTFIPLPADTYILNQTPYASAINIALVGGFFNTVAVLFEKYFVSRLLLFKKGEKIKKMFNESSFSHYFLKYPALVLFVAALTPLPFEPFRLLAITNNYSNSKYSIVTFLGRGIRYWILVVFGNFLLRYQWLTQLIVISLVLYFVNLFRNSWINKETNLERQRRNTIFLSYLSFIAAILFLTFFQVSKHLSWLISAAHFVSDPYDAVWSFAIQVAVAVGVVNLIRLYLIKRYEIQGRYLFIARGNLIIGWAIALTILVDSIAVAIKHTHFQLSAGATILYLWMFALIILSAFIIVESYQTKKILIAETGKFTNGNNELNRLFNIRFLKPINPGIHPIKFSVLLSILAGLLLSLVHVIAEGSAPTVLKTILTFSVLMIIEAVGVFILLIVIGKYLGVLGPIIKRQAKNLKSY
jgi:hypothetical protein